VGRIKSIGNAVHPAVSEWIGRRIVESFYQPTPTEGT
jgi:site-specific DNA-cytosine methylase